MSTTWLDQLQAEADSVGARGQGAKAQAEAELHLMVATAVGEALLAHGVQLDLDSIRASNLVRRTGLTADAIYAATHATSPLRIEDAFKIVGALNGELSLSFIPIDRSSRIADTPMLRYR